MTRRRKIGLILALSLGLPVCLVLIAVAALQTGPGRDALVRYLESELSSPETGRVHLGRLEGPLFERPRFAEIRIENDRGAWLRIEELAIAWQPLALLSGTLRLDAIGAKHIDLQSLPDGRPEGQEDGTSGIPSLPLSIVIEQLTVGELSLGESILGEAASLSLEARAAAPAAGDFEASLQARRVDGKAGELSAKAILHREREELGLEIQAAEPEGGVLARLLGLPGLPAVELSLRGTGELGDWRGKLVGEASDLAHLSADIRLDGRGPLVTEIAGTTEVTGDLPLMATDLLGGKTTFKLKVSWDHEAQQLGIDHLTVETGTLALEGDGRLRGELVEARLSVRSNAPAPLAALIAPVDLVGFSAQARISGSILEPGLDLEASLEGLKVADVAIEQSRIRLSARPDKPLKNKEITFNVEGDADLAGFRLPEAGLEPLIGDTPSLGFKGTLDFQSDSLRIASLAVTGRTMHLTTNGSLDLETFAGNFDGTLALPDLAALDGLAGLPLGGEAGLEFRIEGPFIEGSFDLDLKGGATRVTMGLPELEALLGPAIELKARIEGKPETLRISDLLITGSSLDLAGNAVIRQGSEAFEADYQLEMRELADLDPLVGMALSGGAKAKGRAFGTFTKPAVEGTLTVKEASLQGVDIARLAVEYRLENTLVSPKGSIRFDAQTGYGAAAGESKVHLTERGRLAFSDLVLGHRDGRVTGDVSIVLATGLLEGRLAGQQLPLEPWSDLADVALSGHVTGELRLEATQTTQSAQVELSGIELAFGDIQAGRFQLTGTLDDLFGRASGKLRGDVAALVADTAVLDSATIQATGDLSAATFSLDLKGDLSGPLTLAASGRLARDNQGIALDMNDMTGQFVGRPIALTGPLTLRHGPKGTSITKVAMRFDGGDINASGKLTQESVTADIGFEGLPLSLAALAAPGREFDSPARCRR
jgi:translocation and assembly module TamB